MFSPTARIPQTKSSSIVLKKAGVYTVFPLKIYSLKECI